MDDHKYPVTYKIEHHKEGLTKKEIEDAGLGGCDSVVLVSIMKDKGVSYMTLSMDGQTGENLTPEDIFRVWAVWAHVLSEHLPDGGRKELCYAVHEAVKAALLDAKAEKDN